MQTRPRAHPVLHRNGVSRHGRPRQSASSRCDGVTVRRHDYCDIAVQGTTETRGITSAAVISVDHEENQEASRRGAAAPSLHVAVPSQRHSCLALPQPHGWAGATVRGTPRPPALCTALAQPGLCLPPCMTVLSGGSPTALSAAGLRTGATGSPGTCRLLHGRVHAHTHTLTRMHTLSRWRPQLPPVPGGASVPAASAPASASRFSPFGSVQA